MAKTDQGSLNNSTYAQSGLLEAISLANSAIQALEGAIFHNVIALSVYQSTFGDGQRLGEAPDAIRSTFSDQMKPDRNRDRSRRDNRDRSSGRYHIRSTEQAKAQRSLSDYFKHSKTRRGQSSVRFCPSPALSPIGSEWEDPLDGSSTEEERVQPSTTAPTNQEEAVPHYAIVVGRNPGVYAGSDGISANLSGIPGAIVVKCKTREEADDAYSLALRCGRVQRVTVTIDREVITCPSSENGDPTPDDHEPEETLA